MNLNVNVDVRERRAASAGTCESLLQCATTGKGRQNRACNGEFLVDCAGWNGEMMKFVSEVVQLAVPVQ